LQSELDRLFRLPISDLLLTSRTLSPTRVPLGLPVLLQQIQASFQIVTQVFYQNLNLISPSRIPSPIRIPQRKSILVQQIQLWFEIVTKAFCQAFHMAPMSSRHLQI